MPRNNHDNLNVGLTSSKRKTEPCGGPLTPIGSVAAVLVPANLSPVTKVTVPIVSTQDIHGERYVLPDYLR